MKHERISGSLREDLELAMLDYLTLQRFNEDDPFNWTKDADRYFQQAVAPTWNLWPEALRDFLRYQHEGNWIADFNKGVG